MSNELIQPNGGTLVNRMVEGDAAKALAEAAASMPSITLSD